MGLGLRLRMGLQLSGGVCLVRMQVKHAHWERLWVSDCRVPWEGSEAGHKGSQVRVVTKTLQEAQVTRD